MKRRTRKKKVKIYLDVISIFIVILFSLSSFELDLLWDQRLVCSNLQVILLRVEIMVARSLAVALCSSNRSCLRVRVLEFKNEIYLFELYIVASLLHLFDCRVD